MSKTKVICFANNKGGSGKTTTCSNVGCALAVEGKKVLLIDGDMQLNLTISYFDDETALGYAKSGKNIYRIIKEEADISEAIVHTSVEGVDMVPSSSLMSGIEYELFSKWQREFILKRCLEKTIASGVYDYILIDAPPTLGGWVMNILCACDGVVIPVEASPWGLFGLANMFEFINKAGSMAPRLKLLGVAVTKADERKKYFRQTVETLKAMQEVRLFENFVRVDSAIEWSQDNSRPIVIFKKKSRSALEYKNLAKEIATYADR